MKEFAKEFCDYIDEIIELIVKPNYDEKKVQEITFDEVMNNILNNSN